MDRVRASIHDVARQAGVSAATVSKVLRGVKTVKPANAKRVRQAVLDLNYRLDPLASGLRRATRQIIGVVVPELESEFFGRLTSRLEILAEQAGYSLAIATSHESESREQKLLERMHDWRVAGTILAPVRSERGKGARVMQDYGMTGVLVDRVSANTSFDTVTADNARASARVAQTLIQAGHGHVLLASFSEVSKNIRTRISAFRDAASSSGMKIDVLLVDGTMQELRESLSGYLGKTRPGAIFSLSQRATIAVLSEFREHAIQCPQDISLVGFDDAQWMQATNPPISAVTQPIAGIAEQAFKRLLSRINGDDGFAMCQLEPCDFELRASLRFIPSAPMQQIQNQ